MKPLTSLGLVLGKQAEAEKAAPELPKPEIDVGRMVKFWVKPSINPCRQRKGKSGEIARRGPW
jgi:hypothetical protein